MTPILIYRDRLLPSSEWAFMRRQYMGFSRLAPHWIGCRQEPRLEGSGIADPLIIGGAVSRWLFKQFGAFPRSPDLRALAPALIHAQFGKGGALALPLARKLGIPLVVTFHGGDAFKETHYRSHLIPPVFQRRWQALIETAALFVCVSEGVRDKLIERGVPPEKLEVIAIGADNVLPVYPEGRVPEHLLFAGRFVEKKGIFVLIEALKRLRDKGIDVPVVMAGAGPLLAEAMAEAAVLENVRFPGWLSGEEIRALTASAHALLVPSIAGKGGDAEGLPSVAVEAMAAAVPVIASDAAGLTTVLGEAGMIVPANDATALADAMAEAVSDRPRRDRMARAALSLATTTFSAETQSRRLEDRLLSIIGSHRHEL